MPRYLVKWKTVNARVSEDPATNLKKTGDILRRVQRDLVSGSLKDWGMSPDGSTGYAVFEGSEQDLCPSRATAKDLSDSWARRAEAMESVLREKRPDEEIYQSRASGGQMYQMLRDRSDADVYQPDPLEYTAMVITKMEDAGPAGGEGRGPRPSKPGRTRRGHWNLGGCVWGLPL